VRKAFFVIPLAAAFSERPRVTARWSVLAVGAFTLQATLAGGHPPGVLNSWQKLAFNQDLYLAWTGAAATMLALALCRRTAQIEELAQSRQRLVTHAIDAVERERTRLASALHDSPVQNLIAARHDLRRAERSGDPDSFLRLHEAIDETIRELREEIFNLHPHVLDHVGLKAALEQVARRHSGKPELSVTVDVDPDAGEIHRDVLFALGRELLGTAVKHAQASEIRLSLQRDQNLVRLLVEDDGRGIPSGRMRQALLDGHVGLAAVSERVATLGGSLAIDTARGAGTWVEVSLPAGKSAEERRAAEVQVAELEPRSQSRHGSQRPGATERSAERAHAESEVSDRVTPYRGLWVSTT
jgi:two-component system, NarL family, sensor kinase